MAISIEGGSRGRRKSLAADLNLVPYIDLLTCMVAFLLITAVWTQLARIEVAQKGQGQEEGIVERGLDISVVVHEAGFTLVVDRDQKPLPKRDGALDYAALATALNAIKQIHPDASEAKVLSEDQIPFDILVQTMDTARSAGFRALSLEPATL
jgi:biopolymer transport protein ExbD